MAENRVMFMGGPLDGCIGVVQEGREVWTMPSPMLPQWIADGEPFHDVRSANYKRGEWVEPGNGPAFLRYNLLTDGGINGS